MASPVTPPDLQVRALLDVDDAGVLLAGTTEPTETHLWRWSDGELHRLTHAPGVYSGRAAGGTTLVSHSALDHGGAKVTLERGGRTVARVASHADRPAVLPRVELRQAGARNLRTAVLVPTGLGAGARTAAGVDGPVRRTARSARGGRAQRPPVLPVACRPGLRGRRRGWPRDAGARAGWERAVWRDLAGPVLEDQVDALHALGAQDRPWLDLTRVGIRGWSFGGYLATLAVLRRPDVFHAAVAGAPVTDWALYDTHYTERYLGTPQEDPEAYARSSLHGRRRPAHPAADAHPRPGR